jgi:DNA-binding beta-propeller fold protein YncE
MKQALSITLLIFLILGPSSAEAQTFIELFRFGGAGNAQAQFQKPSAISVSHDGTIYVVDTGNNRLQLFDIHGKIKKSVGGFGFAEDQFDQPLDIWTASIINIYVADYNNRRIQRYDRNFNFLSSLSNQVSLPLPYQFLEVGSCAVSSQNDLFLLDCGENKIIKFNRLGQPERSFGSYESGDGQLQDPVQLDIVNNNQLLVSDVSLKAALVFDLFGNYIKSVTHPDFRAPRGIATFPDGRALIADPEAKKLFLIQPGLAEIQALSVHCAKPLSQPLDAAFLPAIDKAKNNHMLLVLDQNEVLVGNLVEP